MTKAELIALLDGMGVEDDTPLEFFHGSIHYAEQGAATLARYPGVGASAVFVKVA